MLGIAEWFEMRVRTYPHLTRVSRICDVWKPEETDWQLNSEQAR